MSNILKSREDFEWHKKELDVASRRCYTHRGEPERFPCRVISEWFDESNGPDGYDHSFIYEQVVKCEHCGHETTILPDHQ